MKKRALASINQLNRPHAIGMIIALIVAIAGFVLIRQIGAATFVTSLEAENGIVSGRASRISGTSGASGDTVAFGAAPSGGYKPGFVYRNGKSLMLDGQVWRFVGVNNYDLTGCHTGSPMSQAATDQFFASLRPKSLTRVWAFQEQGEVGIAQTVAAAEKYGQKILFALADGAEYCGSPHFDANWYSSGYKSRYLSWLDTLLPKYKNSPAVAVWEIMNEPGQASGGGLNQSMIKSFYDTTAARIKSLDPNHLVSTGALAPWQSFQNGVDGYANVHSGPNIDLVSVHEYDYGYNSSRTIISGHFSTAKQAADRINKPIFIGETGISLASGCMTADERAVALKQKFDGYLGQGAAGVLYWVTLGAPNNAGSVCNTQYGNREPSIGPVATMMKNYTISGSPAPNPTPPISPVPPSVPVGAGSHNDDNFTYSGVWGTGTGTGKYGGDDHYSDVAGSYYTMQFTGTQAKLYGAVAAHHGIMAVSVDNSAEVDIDCYTALRAEQRLLYTTPTLSSGTHTVKVRVTGSKNSASTGAVVTVDRIDIL